MSYVIQWLMKRVLTEIVAMAGVDKFSGCDWRQITCHHSGETERGLTPTQRQQCGYLHIYISIHTRTRRATFR